MFPERIPEHILSDPHRGAEIKVYRALEASLPRAFTVFYGVRWLARTGPGPRRDGEADFVLAHPEKGMLVLEVKGGGIRRDGAAGKWLSVDHHGAVHEINDPFEQVVRSKHALIDRVHETPGWKSRWIRAGHGVVFPDCANPGGMLGIDSDREVVAFAEDLDHLDVWVGRAFDLLAETHFHPFESGADLIQVLERLLARSFNLTEPLGRAIARDSEAILRLTEGQFRLLDFLSERRRAAIRGGAGTGKTMLAEEKARRLAGRGLRTFLTCYNRALGEILEDRNRGQENLTVRHFHRFCHERSVEAGLKVRDQSAGEPPPEYWTHELPEMLLEAMDRGAGRRFDAIVVDEGQDFSELWWTILQFCLEDTDNGILYVFFDDGQCLLGRTPHIPDSLEVYPLTENRRNTRAIYRVAAPFSRCRRTEASGPEGRPVEFVLAGGARERQKRVGAVLQRLVHEEKVAPVDIVVLVDHSENAQELLKEGRLGPCEVTADVVERSHRVLLRSIRQFKGLERPVAVLVLTDAILAEPDYVYTGLTRANAHLVVVGSERVREALGV